MFEIGTNYCEYFVVGQVDQTDSFYLRGHFENGAPVLSGRIFGPDGSLVLELVENEITRRSPSGNRRVGFHNGWSIRDEGYREMLRITTEEDDTPLGRGMVTHINGDMYDKSGRQVCQAGNKGFVILAGPFAMG